MSKVFVIGYGNTLRGDDAAGVRAADLIAQHHPESICVCLHQLAPELAEQIAECDIVFFNLCTKRYHTTECAVGWAQC